MSVEDKRSKNDQKKPGFQEKAWLCGKEMAGQLTIKLLGGVEIAQGGKPVTGLRGRKAEALLAYLACCQRPFPRQLLADFLWDDRPPQQASANFRSLLSSLRSQLNPYLTITRETVAFNHESDYWLDTAEFTRLLETGEPVLSVSKDWRLEIGDWRLAISNLQKAISLYQGDFLAGFYIRSSRRFEEWASLERERLRQLAATALHRLVDHYLHSGQYETGIQYAGHLLQLDSLNEAAQRQMMLLLVRSGQRSAALAQYESCRLLLADELGVEPTETTTRLYQRIKAAAAVGAHNLPVQTTPFVGRETELREITRRLLGADGRLLTLTGPGGGGKTRLALAAARQCRMAFLHGVCFVPLAALDSAGFLVTAIAAALRLNRRHPADPQAQLLDALRPQELLLVLDNFEHLLGGASLLVDILENAPDVKLLVTSRQRLKLREERTFAVAGLPAPADMEMAQATKFGAIQLFRQSARRARSDFDLAGDQRADVVRICQLVEGLPLGIELAAAWVRVLSCREIAAEIEKSLAFLRATARDAPRRHRSLQAVFDHSWALLSPAEQRVLSGLSVFRGGFDREAARQVAGASLKTLRSLINKSLLPASADGRYEIHEAVRQFAAEKLAVQPDEQHQTEALHSAYYAAFLEGKDDDWLNRRQQSALDEISVEIENARAGWNWAAAHGGYGELERSLTGLFNFYEARGWLQEAEAALERATTELGETAVTEGAGKERELTHGRLLVRQGRFCMRLGQYAKAGRLLETALAMLQNLNAPVEIARCLGYLGVIAHIQGDAAPATQLGQESLALAGKLKHREGIAFCLNLLGNIARAQGEYDRAKEQYEKSLVIRQELGDWFSVAVVLNNLGNVAQAQKAYAAARRQYEESRAIFEEIDHRPGMAAALTNAGHVAWKLGDYAEAKRLNQESLDIKRELGNQRGITVSLTNLGEVACSLGEYQESRRSFHEALRLAMEIKALPLTLEILVGMATLLVKEGEPERAVALLALAQHHQAGAQETQERAAQLLSELAAGATAEPVATAATSGEAGSLERVVANILTNSW